VHYRVSDPFGAVLAFVIIPLAFGLQVRFVIRRKTFHLLFCKIHLKIVIVFCGGVQLLSGHDELLAGQPAAGIDDDVANVPGSMIENHVIDFPKFLVIRSIKMRSANVFRCV